MSENQRTQQPGNQPGKQPGARKATKAAPATKARTADKGTKPGKASAGRSRRRNLYIALAAILAIALTATLTIALRDPSDIGPLDATIKGDPKVDEADRILVDQDNDGTPDSVLDLNDNNRADKGEPSLAELAHQRTTIVNDIAANPATVHESLITPPGDDWWTFTTSQAADLLLWETTAPKNATWHGMTTGRADNPQFPNPTYHAIHIGFPTASNATTYMEEVGTSIGPRIRGALRGTVVTLTSAHVDPYAEPFPKTGKTLDATSTSLRPTAAAWTLNLGQQHADLADTAAKKAWGTALTTYHHNLGFTDDTIWNGVAATPEGPWTGTLTGYQPDNIDLTAASQAITGTQKFKCTKDGSTCVDVGASLTNLAFYTSAATSTQSIGGVDATDPNAEADYAPTGTTLTFTANNTAIRGITEGTYQVPIGPYTLINGTITTGVRDQHVLTVTFTEADEPTQIATELPDPNFDPNSGPKGNKGNKGNKGVKTPEMPQPGDPV
jgi:hypothetical protein